MVTSQEFEDSLIDWTSPVVEHQLSRPLIPLPVFTSPQSAIDVDNPFDALERQINDEVLDLLNVSLLNGSGQSSPVEGAKMCNNSELAESEILIQLNDDNRLSKPTTKVPALPSNDVVDESSLPLTTNDSLSLSERLDIHEMVVKRISTCTGTNQALNNTFSDVSRTFSFRSNNRLNDGFLLSSLNSEQDGGRERSRSVELTWNLSDVDEDIRSIVMPTWSDEVSSSSDEEYDSCKLSRSLPIKISELSPEKPFSQILKVNASTIVQKLTVARGLQNADVKTRKEQTVLKNSLLNAELTTCTAASRKKKREEEKSFVSGDKLKSNINSMSLKKVRINKPTTVKWHTPIASSTPNTRKDSPGRRGMHHTTSWKGSPLLRRKENTSRAPSPDSTSNLRTSSRGVKLLLSKDRITKIGTACRNPVSSSKVSSSQTSLTSKLLNQRSLRQKEKSSLSFKI